MEQVFSYIIGLGAAVMMPVLFTILGVCIGIKFSKALKSGLYVGVGFVGLGIITKLLTTSLSPALSDFIQIYDFQLSVFDMGWPAAASVAYNTTVGAFIIPVCLAVNLILLLLGCTRTVNIDLWNYWHFAFIGAVTYFLTDGLGWSYPVAWGFFAAIVCYIITLCMADMTAKKFQSFYEGMDGISIPQPFCQGFTPFAIAIGKVLDKIPGFDRLDIDADGMKKKFGLFGEPLFLGIIIGIIIGCLGCDSWDQIINGLSKDGDSLPAFLNGSTEARKFTGGIPAILLLGVNMGAVMELIPRITGLFIEGLKPISEATRELIAKKFGDKKDFYIGMSPALVIGHPTTLIVSLLLIPVTLVLAVLLSKLGVNQFLPLASLAGMFYVFVMILPYTKGNVVKSFIVGLIVVSVGLVFVTLMAPDFTQAAHQVSAAHPEDGAVKVPDGFNAGALDFASSPIAFLIYGCMAYLKYIGAAVLVVITGAMVAWNRKKINAK